MIEASNRGGSMSLTVDESVKKSQCIRANTKPEASDSAPVMAMNVKVCREKDPILEHLTFWMQGTHDVTSFSTKVVA